MERMYLIQNGRFREKNKEEDEIKGFSHIVNLTLMGAAEFEGAVVGNKIVNPLGQSIKRIISNHENYEFAKITKKKDAMDRQMYVYCNREETKETIEMIRKFIKNEYSKMPACLKRYLESSKEELQENKYLKDFWWDIENDFVIFFGEDKLERISELIEKIVIQENQKRKQNMNLFEKIKVRFIDYVSNINWKLCK